MTGEQIYNRTYMHSNNHHYPDVSTHSVASSRTQQEDQVLRSLIDEERRNHLLEIQSINQKIQEYSAAQREECVQYEKQLSHWKEKALSYRGRCNRLAQQNQHHSESVKSLMQKKIGLEKELIGLRQDLETEREKGEQGRQCVTQLQHIVRLLQLQNQQLKDEAVRLQQQLHYVRTQFHSQAHASSKFDSFEQIAEHQHQQQIDILKGELQQQLQANTVLMLQRITEMQPNAEVGRSEEKENEGRGVSREMVELKTLASCVEYGSAYFEVENVQLRLGESRKVYQFISSLFQQNQALNKYLQEQNNSYNELREQYKESVEAMQSQLHKIKKEQGVERGVQAGNTTKVDQIVSANTSLKRKMLQVQKVLHLMSQAVVFLKNAGQAQIQKGLYYNMTQQAYFRQLKNNKKPLYRFRSATIAVSFIEALRIMSQKRKRKAQSLDNDQSVRLTHNLRDSRLGRLVRKFLSGLKQQQPASNRAIQKLLKQPSGSHFAPEALMVDVLAEECGNRGLTSQGGDFLKLGTRMMGVRGTGLLR